MGVDPGRTCGIALYDRTTLQVLQASEAMTQEALAEAIVNWRPDVIAVEDFIGSGPRNVHGIYTLKLIGFVHGVGLMLEIPVIEQEPQFRRPRLTEAKKLAPRATVHAQDALAHALAYHKAHLEELASGQS
jgi:hypothetical protein